MAEVREVQCRAGELAVLAKAVRAGGGGRARRLAGIGGEVDGILRSSGSDLACLEAQRESSAALAAKAEGLVRVAR